MRTKLLLAASAALLSLNAGADDLGAGRVDVVGAQPKRVAMAPLTFERMQGEYQLEDGRVLRIVGKGAGKARSLYADLGDGPVEIVHVGQHRFVGVGKNVRLAFEGDRYSSSVRVTSAAPGRLAQHGAVQARPRG